MEVNMATPFDLIKKTIIHTICLVFRVYAPTVGYYMIVLHSVSYIFLEQNVIQYLFYISLSYNLYCEGSCCHFNIIIKYNGTQINI